MNCDEIKRRTTQLKFHQGWAKVARKVKLSAWRLKTDFFSGVQHHDAHMHQAAQASRPELLQDRGRLILLLFLKGEEYS